MFADDAEYFVSSDQWLHTIGKFHVSFVENTIGGYKERRVLFDDALDVDFVIIPCAAASSGIIDKEALAIFERGYRILIDKIGLEKAMSQISQKKEPYSLLPEEEFLNIVNDFWYHTVWTAKKLKRGELWTAKGCLDSHMKQKLLILMECYAHATNGINYDTWHNGRFIEEWAEPWIIEMLPKCFSHYNKEGIKAALLSTMDLFRTISVEIAKRCNYKYPYRADEYTTKLVASMI